MTVAARNPLRFVVIGSLLFAVGACKGGGGSDESGGSSPRLNLSVSAVTISAPVTSGTRPTSSITVAVENAGTTNYYIRVQHSSNGIANLGSTRDRGPLEVLLDFKTPYDLRPATYSDTLVFDLCTDGTCASLVAGASITVPVQYTVVAPSAGQAPSITLSLTSLDLQALVTDVLAPGVPIVDLTLSGLESSPFVTVVANGTAVQRPVYAPGSPAGLSGGQLYADVHSPGTLGPGVYHGTVTVTACLDRSCVNPLAGSPVTLSVRLTVANQVDGPHGYRIRIVEEFVDDVVWDETRQRFYMSTPDTFPQGSDHRISVVDPATASVVSSIAVAWTPSLLAISADDQFLYVSSTSSPLAVRRLRTSDLSIDATIPTGISPTGVEYFARGISVAPDQPQTIAVVRATNLDNPANGGLALFDNTTRRPAVLAEQPDGATGPFMDRVTWGADSSTLFAGNLSAQTRELYALTADASGARIARQVAASNLARSVHFGAGLVYSDGGVLYDPVTLATIDVLDVPQAGAFADVTTIDAPGNRVFLMWNWLDPLNTDAGFSRNLSSFDLPTRAQIATIPLHSQWHPVKMIRWGTDGLALVVRRSFDSRLILIDGAFIRP